MGRGVAPVRLEPIAADESGSGDENTPLTEFVAKAPGTVPELRALPSLFE